MPTIHVEAQVSSGELLKALEQLSPPELDRLVAQILELRAQRVAPRLTCPETELLQRINQGLPETVRQRYDELLAKRRAETLSPEEHAELLRLTEQAEKLDAHRLQALVELAQVRKTSLAALLRDLGLPVQTHE